MSSSKAFFCNFVPESERYTSKIDGDSRGLFQAIWCDFCFFATNTSIFALFTFEIMLRREFRFLVVGERNCGAQFWSQMLIEACFGVFVGALEYRHGLPRGLI